MIRKKPATNQTTQTEQQIVSSLTRQSKNFLAQSQEIQITNDEEYSQAGEFLAGIKSLIKKIQAHHEPMLVKAMEARSKADEVVKVIKSKEREMIEPAEGAKRCIQSGMQRYLSGRREREQEQKRLIEEQLGVKSGVSDLIPESLEIIPERPKPIGTKVYERWKFEVVDESKLKPAFLMPNLSEIKSIVEAMKDEKKAERILGEGSVRVWVEQEVR